MTTARSSFSISSLFLSRGPMQFNRVKAAKKAAREAGKTFRRKPCVGICYHYKLRGEKNPFEKYARKYT